VVDRADRTGVKGKPRAKHENIAEPECHAGHYGETSDFARRQSGLRIDPIADRACGDQRKAEGERNRVARERGQRRRLIGNAGGKLA